MGAVWTVSWPRHCTLSMKCTRQMVCVNGNVLWHNRTGSAALLRGLVPKADLSDRMLLSAIVSSDELCLYDTLLTLKKCTSSEPLYCITTHAMSIAVSGAVLVVIVSMIAAWLSHSRAWNKRAQGHALPPGPKRWPIVGNMLDFGTKQPWLLFDHWADTYGLPCLVRRCRAH